MASPKRTPFVAVVDDDAGMRNATRNLLHAAGFATTGYASAEAFLKSKRSRQAGFIVLDMQLPGMGGLELHAALRAEKLKIPTVLVTADHDKTVRAEALAAGILAVLYKPFDADSLLRQVQKALD